ncbi:RNase P modulator RnpM [Chengkuizengella axinellae]|uniref:YlxR family protein n=1 Tax=Chengkuizengella axinellae TaxID=3064388 RepID=A0ABT9IVU8_9BACL|nr:YlxR family protein [Chengkuizengella sp. 2205SS18-9]MDP5273481.1 YlxR family protein [Chengkuizengella sp. 2205SS18-9]
MRTRKIPMRKCVACQEMKPKKELIRIVRSPENEVIIDSTGKKSGRGAYICKQVSCSQLAMKNKSLDRALKHQVNQEVYDQLESNFSKLEGQDGK